jgi:hypothetical protein
MLFSALGCAPDAGGEARGSLCRWCRCVIGAGALSTKRARQIVSVNRFYHVAFVVEDLANYTIRGNELCVVT